MSLNGTNEVGRQRNLVSISSTDDDEEKSPQLLRCQHFASTGYDKSTTVWIQT